MICALYQTMILMILLKENTELSVHALKLKCTCVMQWDNDLKYASNGVNGLKNKMKVLEWPRQSWSQIRLRCFGNDLYFSVANVQKTKK